jgi:hypothetical protein
MISDYSIPKYADPNVILYGDCFKKSPYSLFSLFEAAHQPPDEGHSEPLTVFHPVIAMIHKLKVPRSKTQEGWTLI